MIEIRQAVASDAEALCAAEVETARTPGLLVSRPHELANPGMFRSKIAELSDPAAGRYVVALEDGRLAGHALLDKAPRVAFAHVVRLTIVVHPGFTDRGIGRALMDHLIAWARSAPDIERIELNVRATNLRAIALYRRCGFEEEGRRRRGVMLEDGTYVDDVCMALFVK